MKLGQKNRLKDMEYNIVIPNVKDVKNSMKIIKLSALKLEMLVLADYSQQDGINTEKDKEIIEERLETLLKEIENLEKEIEQNETKTETKTERNLRKNRQVLRALL